MERKDKISKYTHSCYNIFLIDVVPYRFKIMLNMESWPSIVLHINILQSTVPSHFVKILHASTKTLSDHHCLIYSILVCSHHSVLFQGKVTCSETLQLTQINPVSLLFPWTKHTLHFLTLSSFLLIFDQDMVFHHSRQSLWRILAWCPFELPVKGARIIFISQTVMSTGAATSPRDCLYGFSLLASNSIYNVSIQQFTGGKIEPNFLIPLYCFSQDIVVGKISSALHNLSMCLL